MKRNRYEREVNKPLIIAIIVVVAVLIVSVFTFFLVKKKMENEALYREKGIEALNAANYDEAVNDFNIALSNAVAGIGDFECDICYYKAAAQYASGDLDGALETYNALVNYDEKDPRVRFLRGCIYLEQDERLSAIADYNVAAENTSDIEMILQIYDNLESYGMHDEAEVYLRQTIDSGVKNTAGNLLVKGRAYLITGDYENAVKALKQSVEKGNTKAYLYLYKVYEETKDSENAEDALAKYVENYPESSVALNVQGCEAFERADYETAITCFLQGLAVDDLTNEQELKRNLIASYEFMGDFDTAWSYAKEYIEKFEDDEEMQREAEFIKSRATAE